MIIETLASFMYFFVVPWFSSHETLSRWNFSPWIVKHFTWVLLRSVFHFGQKDRSEISLRVWKSHGGHSFHQSKQSYLQFNQTAWKECASVWSECLFWLAFTVRKKRANFKQFRVWISETDFHNGSYLEWFEWWKECCKFSFVKIWV